MKITVITKKAVAAAYGEIGAHNARAIGESSSPIGHHVQNEIDRAMANFKMSIREGTWWCNTHQRPADSFYESGACMGQRCCSGPGICLPCQVIFAQAVVK